MGVAARGKNARQNTCPGAENHYNQKFSFKTHMAALTDGSSSFVCNEVN